MNKWFLLLLMLFLHTLYDFHLQGILSNMKQKSWWIDHPQYKDLYQWDYVVSLLIHSFEWAFLLMLPAAYLMKFNIDVTFFGVFILNVAIHSVVDHVKANRMKLNLVSDQIIHVIQIIYTWMIFVGKLGGWS